MAQSVVFSVIDKPARIEIKMSIQQLLTLDELAQILGRSPDTIKKDMRRKPEAVPPRLVLPHTRLLRWRVCDVEVWLGQFVQVSAIKGEKK